MPSLLPLLSPRLPHQSVRSPELRAGLAATRETGGILTDGVGGLEWLGLGRLPPVAGFFMGKWVCLPLSWLGIGADDQNG